MSWASKRLGYLLDVADLLPEEQLQAQASAWWQEFAPLLKENLREAAFCRLQLRTFLAEYLANEAQERALRDLLGRLEKLVSEHGHDS